MLSKSAGAVVRALVIVAVLAAWLAIGGVGGMAQGRLSQVQTNDNAAFLPSSAESTRAAEAGQGFIDEETLPVLVVMTPSDGGDVTPAQLAGVQEYLQTIPQIAIPGADAAEGDPVTFADILVGPAVAVPSEDGKALLVPLSLDAAQTEDPLADGEGATGVIVDELRASLADELGATADSAGELGLQAWVTGPGGYVADLVEAFGGIDGVLLLVALGAVFVILVLVYRSPFLPVIVIFSAVFALCLAALVVYNLAANDVLVLNGQAQGILSILVVGAAVDYSLLLVSRYREELRRVQSPYTAMARAVRGSIEPIAASAGTVIAGLLCLLLSDLGSNRSLGPVGAIGIASALLATLTLLPALLLILGSRSRGLFWPRKPRPTEVGAHGVAPAQRPTAEVLTGLWGRLARFVGAHARPVWALTTLLLVAGAAFLPTLQASGTSQSDVFLTPVDSVAGEEVLAEHFPAGVVQPAVVIAPEGDLDAVLEAAQAVDGVESATPVTDQDTGAPVGGAPQGDQGEPRVVDGTVKVTVVTTAGSDTQGAVETIEELRTAVHDVSPDALVGGAAAQTLDTQLAGARDLKVIVPTVLAVILVILVILLRAFVAPLLLMVANVLSFGAALGISAIVFNHVLDFPGADPTVPLYSFVFLVALGVDYSIFLMTRVREETVHFGTRAGVLRGLAVTGGVITSAGVVLAATFGALGILPLLFLAQLAFIVALGVLIDTLIVRSLLVPALVHDLGRVAWWPSRLAREDVEAEAIAAHAQTSGGAHAAGAR
ncbi:MMPL family transporter [Cellulomonas sp. zg-Y338]|uniref:MMPL family transporter n=2 Tax=Cellulomonas chengniuliangii TaxID=2968084 RepID=A0ABY5L4V7_9CELL|nr:MMPL family transporter [Cellulomonas chengniuliangii]MCC2308142.1 MMPL family transporter [Cellulomonas chengniuliangii]UUI76536.1 MMPL family transporter [Cellulomonas chengniuliangii]